VLRHRYEPRGGGDQEKPGDPAESTATANYALAKTRKDRETEINPNQL
jgi:hypothetical protein